MIVIEIVGKLAATVIGKVTLGITGEGAIVTLLGERCFARFVTRQVAILCEVAVFALVRHAIDALII